VWQEKKGGGGSFRSLPSMRSGDWRRKRKKFPRSEGMNGGRREGEFLFVPYLSPTLGRKGKQKITVPEILTRSRIRAISRSSYSAQWKGSKGDHTEKGGNAGEKKVGEKKGIVLFVPTSQHWLLESERKKQVCRSRLGGGIARKKKRKVENSLSNIQKGGSVNRRSNFLPSHADLRGGNDLDSKAGLTGEKKRFYKFSFNSIIAQEVGRGTQNYECQRSTKRGGRYDELFLLVGKKRTINLQ